MVKIIIKKKKPKPGDLGLAYYNVVVVYRLRLALDKS